MSEDTISRQAVIEINRSYHGQMPNEVNHRIWKEINELPSAQPETHEKRTETHSCDCISRQAAIRWVKTECNPYGKPTLDFESGKKVIEHLKQMPSAQPEPCVDTIDALDESIKHFDDMAEECRRNANIEQNDYMDMRDDAAEYRQLSIWLNELKWLRERFQSQPDLSEYSDKLWKAAYERGRAEALDEIVRCKDCIFHGFCRTSPKWAVAPKDDWYCADAERRTDGV